MEISGRKSLELLPGNKPVIQQLFPGNGGYCLIGLQVRAAETDKILEE